MALVPNPTVAGVRLTRRGWATLGIAVAGLVLANAFGGRSLNAVILPAFVFLGAAAVMVRRVEAPTVRRTLPPDGFPDDEETVTLHFDTDTPFTGVVRDALSPGLAGETSVETTVGTGPVDYEVRYVGRGEHRLGPVECTARDVFGLAERTLTASGTDTVLVYPRLHRLTRTGRTDLLALHEPSEGTDRDEFDRLREYQRGDSLRDVHWKSSAKRDDLVVKEFSAQSDERPVTVAAGATSGGADRMAEATASVCVTLVDAGIPVELSTPDGECEADAGDRRRLLEHLARAGTGSTPGRAADVVVRATSGSVRVVLGSAEWEFDALTERSGVDGRTGASSVARAAARDGATGEEATGDDPVAAADGGTVDGTVDGEEPAERPRRDGGERP